MLAEIKIVCQCSALRSPASALRSLLSRHRQDVSRGPCPPPSLGSHGVGLRALRHPGLLLEGQWNTPDLGISSGEPASGKEQVWGKGGMPRVRLMTECPSFVSLNFTDMWRGSLQKYAIEFLPSLDRINVSHS